ncbi:hypothetical protein ACOSQ2_027098 [Xanthoceras sorbifolium]
MEVLYQMVKIPWTYEGKKHAWTVTPSKVPISLLTTFPMEPQWSFPHGESHFAYPNGSCRGFHRIMRESLGNSL